MCYDHAQAQDRCLRQDRNKNTCIICNVTNNTLIFVTLDAQGNMPGQDRNKNQCVFCNVILSQVTLFPQGSRLLHWILNYINIIINIFININCSHLSLSYGPRCGKSLIIVTIFFPLVMHGLCKFIIICRPNRSYQVANRHEKHVIFLKYFLMIFSAWIKVFLEKEMRPCTCLTCLHSKIILLLFQKWGWL